MIEDISTSMDELSNYLDILPSLIVFGTVVLVKKFNAVEETYNNMRDANIPMYHIPFEDFKKEMTPIFASIKKDLSKFHHEGKSELFQELDQKIADMDRIIHEEQQKKAAYEKYEHTIYMKTEELARTYLQLQREMNSLKNVYKLSSERVNEFGEIQNDINSMNMVKRDLDTYMHSTIKKPFSILSEQMFLLASKAEVVDRAIIEFKKYLFGLRDSTQVAYELSETFSVTLNEIKSEIRNTNHPIVWARYAERINTIEKMIVELKRVIKTQPIDVEEAKSLVDEIKDLLSYLASDSDNDCSNHNTAEKIIVFTNQYRSSFSEVSDVLKRAELHYQNGEFDLATDITVEVLKKVHPQAYEKYAESSKRGS
jgi:septation ring formation regulator EzrA